MRKAWTMIEVIFVIVIIGILASIAIPKFAVTRNDAKIAAAKATVASVRAALSTERQLRILRGNFTDITKLNTSGGAFSTFDTDGKGGGVGNRVLDTTVPICKTGETGCWTSDRQYLMPGSGTAVNFTLENGRYSCDETDSNCQKLTQ